MSDDPRVVEPGHAPTPFTAAEIRTGCPKGRKVTVRNVDSNQQSSYSTTTFTECDEAGTVLVNQAIDEQGKPIGQSKPVPGHLGRAPGSCLVSRRTDHYHNGVNHNPDR